MKVFYAIPNTFYIRVYVCMSPSKEAEFGIMLFFEYKFILL